MSSTLNIKGTIVFEKNWEGLNSEKRFIRNQGGSRSSKTYSIIQCLVLYCLKNKKKLVSVVRKTGPALTATCYRDFIEILKDWNLYSEAQHNKSEKIYTFPNKSQIEFFSVDNEQKLRGRKRDLCWCNEANELLYDDFQQLNLRTSEKLIIDYNPSDSDNYVYHIPTDDVFDIHSTYKDNPFLEEAIIQQIEAYKTTDESYYQIFALGQRAFSKENVYNKWEITKKPEYLNSFIYGLDFGYSHPTALIKIWFNPKMKELFLEEVIYESHLTSQDIISKMNERAVDKSATIISETARPEIIADLRRSGYKVIEANKNVKDGLNCVKTFLIKISESSYNIIKENENYKYKKMNGVVTEDIVKLYDDAMDAIRYGSMYIKKFLLKEESSSSKIYKFDI